VIIFKKNIFQTVKRYTADFYSKTSRVSFSHHSACNCGIKSKNCFNNVKNPFNDDKQWILVLAVSQVKPMMTFSTLGRYRAEECWFIPL